MKHEEFSDKLMDKLMGELSENEAQLFQEEVSNDPELSNDFAFFEEAWSSMDEFSVVEKPSESLSDNFYLKLNEIDEKEQNTPIAKLNAFLERFNTLSPFARNASFGAFLLLVGFLLGGKFNSKPIVAKVVVEQQPQNIAVAKMAYTPTTEKINYVRSIQQSEEQRNETFRMLKNVVLNERNINVRLAALNKMNQCYSNHPLLRQFVAEQINIEQNPLIQVELLNLMIDNHRTGETIQTMENILTKKRDLNPFVQEKIKKDLPVLRASYVQ